MARQKVFSGYRNFVRRVIVYSDFALGVPGFPLVRSQPDKHNGESDRSIFEQHNPARNDKRLPNRAQMPNVVSRENTHTSR